MYSSGTFCRLSTLQARFVILTIVLPVSGLSTLAGIRALSIFDKTPGSYAAVPAQWPQTSSIRHSATRPELLVFVHPQCACTRATLSELAKVAVSQAGASERPEITVLFSRPENSGWAPGPLWDMAAKLGARTIWDEGGVEAKRFGAQTSGYVVLYSNRGALLYNGGVTASRGHAGDNENLDKLIAALGSGLRANSTRVFGCSIKIQNADAEAVR